MILASERPTAQPAPTRPEADAERLDLRLGRNLVLARAAADVTQESLADAAGLSRATVAQIESGRSDPRLSTLTELAAALGISPLLLLGSDALKALAALIETAPADPFAGKLTGGERERMRALLASGFSKSRLQAVRIAVHAGRIAGLDRPTLVGIAIGLSLHPERGASLAAALARLLAS